MATAILDSPGQVIDTGANFSSTEPLLNGDILYEVIDNEYRELPPMSAREIRFASILLRLLGPFAWNNSLGVADTEMLFLIDKPRNLQRQPDVSYVSFQRWPKGKPVPGTSAWEVVPNLAVEIISPTNGANEILAKLRDYFTCGVQRVWVFYPLFSLVYDYSSPTSVSILTRAENLPGGDVLPGFDLPLSELFEEQTPEA